MTYKNNVLLIIFSLLFFGQNLVAQPKAFESYYLHMKDYPKLDASPSWGEGGREVQGIAHDDNYWYITATEKFYLGNVLNKVVNFVIDYLTPFGIALGNLDNYQNCYLWKIPVSEPLDQDFTNNSKIKQVMLLRFPQLSNAKTFRGYSHWGDLDYYLDPNTKIGYLIIPSNSDLSSLPGRTALVIFRADDLSLVGFGALPGNGADHKQENVGWCAVDTAGFVFTSNDDPDMAKPPAIVNGTYLFKYKVDWNSLKNGYKGDVSKYITFKDGYTLKGPVTEYPDGSKSPLLALNNMQGGQFSPSNEILYLSNGTGKCKTFPSSSSGAQPNDGIHVIDTKTWTEITRSTNHDIEHANYFDYHYDPGCGVFETDSHSAEGLTIWDLDDGRAPQIRGQLHVLVADVAAAPANNAGIEHFTNKIRVNDKTGDPATGIVPISGTPDRPFLTVTDAMTFYPIWDGAELSIAKGTYGDIGKYNKRIKITSTGGDAIIGSANPSIHGVMLYEDINYGGEFRYFDENVPDLHISKFDFNDACSSLRINNIKEVILFENAGYGGESVTIKANAAKLPEGWNDRVSSLKIIRN